MSPSIYRKERVIANQWKKRLKKIKWIRAFLVDDVLGTAFVIFVIGVAIYLATKMF